ncbi:MAG: hypothetical protein CM15mP125_3910 [Gammaproteobacteria bacterium]|nr:MAG: hypothetical protein CM15mP125_3910 [Gammaproteobacteria bacterium]
MFASACRRLFRAVADAIGHWSRTGCPPAPIALSPGPLSVKPPRVHRSARCGFANQTGPLFFRAIPGRGGVLGLGKDAGPIRAGKFEFAKGYRFTLTLQWITKRVRRTGDRGSLIRLPTQGSRPGLIRCGETKIEQAKTGMDRAGHCKKAAWTSKTKEILKSENLRFLDAPVDDDEVAVERSQRPVRRTGRRAGLFSPPFWGGVTN